MAVRQPDPHRELAEAFYAHVEHDPVLRPVYRGAGPGSCPARVFGDYLSVFFGPSGNSKTHWWLSLREAHQRFQIGPEHRAAWLKAMRQALADRKTEEPARTAMMRFFEQAAAWIVNHPAGTADEAVLERELGAGVEEIQWRWDGLRTLEAAILAIRKGDSPRALALAESPLLLRYFQHDRASFLGLLALMSTVPGPLEDYVRAQISADPGIVREQHGRTLLHQVAAVRIPAMVELLLELGADPNTFDEAGHTPLYSIGNGASEENGPAVVRLLAKAGANLNAQENVKRCTPLHMAARRGHVQVAEALLDCGADIEARDIAGETPLRRAVNCAKLDVAALLLARGADRHSRDRKGGTPALAARSAAMKQLLSKP